MRRDAERGEKISERALSMALRHPVICVLAVDGRQESVPTAKGISLMPSLLRPFVDVPEETEAEELLSG